MTGQNLQCGIKTTTCDCSTFRHDSGTRDYSPVQVVGVSAIINHHAYNTWSKENDMSLLKLQQPLVFNQFVRPINIWMTPLPSFRKCTVTGWGSTRESEQLFGQIACPPQSWSRLIDVSSCYIFFRWSTSSQVAGGERDHPSPQSLQPVLSWQGAFVHVLRWEGRGRSRCLPGRK